MLGAGVVASVLLWSTATAVYADDPNGKKPAQKLEDAMTPEEAAALREGLRALAVAFGVDGTSSQPAAPAQKAQPAQQQKTMADVTDKALDLVVAFASQLSQAVERVAPEVWRIMLKQQYANAVGNIFFPAGALLVLPTYMFTLHKAWKLSDEAIRRGWSSDSYISKGWFVYIIPTILFLGATIWLFWVGVESVKIFMNPEYYAIRDLLRLLIRPGLP